MILIDSSVWIEYYRPHGAAKIQSMVIEAISHDLAAVNGIIDVEILGGITGSAELAAVSSDFDGFHMLELTGESFRGAATMGSRLRKRGLTVPATDLIIAASAIENNAELYHIDNHFDLIARHTALKARNLGALLR